MPGAVAKLMKDRAEKAKSYKCAFDVDRVLALAHAAHLLRDFSVATTSGLVGAIGKELLGMSSKQAEITAKETEEEAKELAAAEAEDRKPVEEEASESPPTRRGR